MDGAIGLTRLSTEAGVDPVLLTQAFSDLGTRLGLDWAQNMAGRLAPSDPWERLLVAGLSRDFQQMRLDFLARAPGASPADAVESWASLQHEPIRQFRALIARAQATTPVSPAMLAQVASQARSLLSR
jgi:glutamate dehydrogenase